MPISAINGMRDVSGSANNESGFTLLELLVVLSLLAITATLVIPAISSNDSKILTAQVSQATSVLNYARRIAIVRSLPGIASFQVMNNENVSVENDEERRTARPNSVHWQSSELSLSYQDDRDQFPEEVEFVEITFFPQGGSSGGILNFQLNEYTASIRVDPITGRISTRYFGEEFGEEFDE